MTAQMYCEPTVLPREGQLIEFVVDGHDVSIVGTYAERTFRSRRSTYEIARVLTWRAAGFDAFGVVSVPEGHPKRAL